MEKLQSLSQRQQSIIPIAAFTADGDINRLKPALNQGLDGGLTVNEIKEVLVHLYAYAGFPRSLNALSAFMGVVDERKAKGIEDVQGKEASPVPSDLNIDLKALEPQKGTLVWLGHSSWFVQLGGKRILIDPVFSDHAGPFSFLNKAFDGTSIYTADDMPEIDCLLISHDHWDHLDYPTVTSLRSKVTLVICPLGVGAYFEYWDYPKDKIREGDWYDRIPLGENITVHVLPARHYSGRLLAKNKTLWAGFALETPNRRIFFSGDSGYGPLFSRIGEAFQGFDLVLLDCGQYDPRWAFIHMTPEEAAGAAQDLGARALIPAHVGRFTIANHPWDEPFKRLAKASQDKSYRLLTPRIGQPMAPDDNPSEFSRWWETEASYQGFLKGAIL